MNAREYAFGPEEKDLQKLIEAQRIVIGDLTRQYGNKCSETIKWKEEFLHAKKTYEHLYFENCDLKKKLGIPTFEREVVKE